MFKHKQHKKVGIVLHITMILVVVCIAITSMPEHTHAIQGTMLINTESFDTIGSGTGGDQSLFFGSSNTEALRFSPTSNRFELTDDAFVQGSQTVSGSLIVDGAIIVQSLVNCNTIDSTSTGQLICGNDATGTGETGTGAYISITTDENSNASAAAYDIFEDGNYPGTLDFTQNAGASITFTASNGRFTVSQSGAYIITLTLIVENSVVGNVEYAILLNGAAIYQHDFLVHSAVDPVERSITIVRNLLPNDYIEFQVDSLTGNATVHDGTSASLSSIGGVGENVEQGIPETTADDRYVDTAGDTMTGNLALANGASLSASGAIRTETGVVLNKNNVGQNVFLTFGNDLGAETLAFSDDNNQFEFSDDVRLAGNVLATGTVSGAALTVTGLQDCSSLTTDTLGNVVCASSSSGGYISVTTTENSTATAVAFDIFEDTNYAGTLDFTSNASSNITFTSADGRFTANATGTYLITTHIIGDKSGNTASDVLIDINSTTVYQHGFFTRDETEKTFSIIRDLSPGDFVEFQIDPTPGGGTFTVGDGTTVNISSLGAGGGSSEGITEAAADTRYVNVDGDTMTDTLTLDQNADSIALDVDSEATGQPGLRIDIAGDSDSPHLQFGQGGTFDTNLYRETADILRTDDTFRAGTVQIPTLQNCSALQTDGNGEISCASNTSSGAFISITTTENSNGFTGNTDVFEDANYPGTLDFTTNSISRATFTSSNGRFTVTETGTYLISYNLIIDNTNFGVNITYEIDLNGASIFQHDFGIHGVTDPVERSITLVREMSANDYLEFFANPAAGTSVVQDGTTVSILQISGLPQDIDADDRYVQTAGDTMTGSLVISNGGSLTVASTISTDDNITLNADNTGADAILTFGNDAGSETLSFSDSLNRFVVSDDLTVQGNLIATSFSGAGLTDCDSSNDHLQWDATTSQFSCVSTIEIQNFEDATADAVADNNTTDYWDGTYPNITPTATTSEVLVMVSMRIQQDAGNNGDDIIVATIKRNIGADPACGSTEVGPEIGGLLSQQNSDETLTAIFVDTPATTSNVRYTICSDADSASIAGDTVEEIFFTLVEVNDAADLAEVYPTMDATLQAGELVMVDPELPSGVKRSAEQQDHRVLGIVSTRPAQVIGGTDGTGVTGVPIALTGRVPVKVSTENGTIAPGDFLTSSPTPGIAMKATSGPVIGQALSHYDDEEIGTVMVFVQRGQHPNPQEKGLIESLQQRVRDLERKLWKLMQ